MKKKIIIVSITLAIIFSIYSVVKATSITEMQEKRTELQKKINEANEQLGDINVQLTDTLENINKLDEQIYNYEVNVNDTKEQLDVLQEEIEKVRYKLDHIEEEYKIQKETFEKRIVTLYEEGDTQYLDVLLNSKSIVEFISNYYLIGEVAEYDSDLLRKYRKTKSTNN